MLEKMLIALGCIKALLIIAYVIALLIPGDHPDRELRWLLEITAKLSRK